MPKSLKNPAQTTVSSASEILGICERSVLNYIKAKEIDAIKVGKKWHVSMPSIEAFKQKYGLLGNTPMQQDTSASRSEGELATLDLVVSATNTKASSLTTLRCYQLCKQAFQMPMWKTIESRNAESADSANPNTTNKNALSQRLISLKHQALESLGAGFHSFHSRSKSEHYDKSRSAIGSILAQLYAAEPAATKDWESEIAFLELNLLPAYSALIKKIEKRKA